MTPANRPSEAAFPMISFRHGRNAKNQNYKQGYVLLLIDESYIFHAVNTKMSAGSAEGPSGKTLETDKYLCEP